MVLGALVTVLALAHTPVPEALSYALTALVGAAAYRYRRSLRRGPTTRTVHPKRWQRRDAPRGTRPPRGACPRRRPELQGPRREPARRARTRGAPSRSIVVASAPQEHSSGSRRIAPRAVRRTMRRRARFRNSGSFTASSSVLGSRSVRVPRGGESARRPPLRRDLGRLPRPSTGPRTGAHTPRTRSHGGRGGPPLGG